MIFPPRSLALLVALFAAAPAMAESGAVSVGSFAVLENAQRQRQEVTDQGFGPASIEKTQINSGTRYRVLVAGTDVDRLKSDVRASGYPGALAGTPSPDQSPAPSPCRRP